MDSSTALPASSISPGCILWLIDPDKGRYSYPDSDEDEDPRFRIISQTMYGHPVMVLHTEGEDHVAVCLVSTISGFPQSVEFTADLRQSSQRSTIEISKSTNTHLTMNSTSRSTPSSRHAWTSIPNFAYMEA